MEAELLVRDWSLITGRGATKPEGGHMKFYRYEKGGGGAAETVLAMLKGGGAHKVLGSFLSGSLKF